MSTSEETIFDLVYFNNISVIDMFDLLCAARQLWLARLWLQINMIPIAQEFELIYGTHW